MFKTFSGQVISEKSKCVGEIAYVVIGGYRNCNFQIESFHWRKCEMISMLQKHAQDSSYKHGYIRVMSISSNQGRTMVFKRELHIRNYSYCCSMSVRIKGNAQVNDKMVSYALYSVMFCILFPWITFQERMYFMITLQECSFVCRKLPARTAG